MMKINKLNILSLGSLFLQLVFIQQIVIAQTDEDYQNIKDANKFYTDGNFQEAATLYQSVADKGFSAPELYYNLGNTYYRLGDYKRSILYYERAILLNPDDENTRINLEFAQAYIQDKIEVVPKFFLIRWGNAFIELFSVNTWSFISIGSFILFLSLIILFLFSKSNFLRKLSFYTGFFSIIIAVTSFNNAYRQHQKLTNHTSAIVFSPAVTVKSSPNESGTDLFIIHEGLKVIITDESPGWKEIKLSDGKVGWLPKDAVQEI